MKPHPARPDFTSIIRAALVVRAFLIFTAQHLAIILIR
ncbi:protein of unknown function [Agrobacterium pusense]|uniref:Uncharacterized protein n=1 Tax=Agrobacterium pusense TaxID=648995 RepID=U4QD77_9HYPH|nr:protein of unknown function [Agrobacterium pusense]